MLLFLLTTIPLLLHATKEDLVVKKALKSGKVFKGLLKSYLQRFHKHYSKKELKGRTKAFSRTLKRVDECNEHEHFHCRLNQFATMTDQEKSAYLGLGNTTAVPRLAAQLQPRQNTIYKRATSKDWRDHGAVSAVKNQGACGACWAFAAAAAVEGSYAATTGRLKSFSEQELLECTYEEHVYDGCLGGWYFDAFNYLSKHQHLSTTATLPYSGNDGTCRRTRADGLIAAQVTGFVKTDGDDWSLAEAIEISPIAVAMLAAGNFFSYSDGEYDGYQDCRAATFPNHAMTAVAFTASSFVVKNSWGIEWGDGGYVSVTRGRNVCFINDYGYYPSLVKTGEDNSDEEEEEDEEEVDCQQNYQDDCLDFNYRDCPGIKSAGSCYLDYMLSYTSQYCQASCAFCNNIPLSDLAADCVQRISDHSCSDQDTQLVCPLSCCAAGQEKDEEKDEEDDEDGCPAGTTMCSDGNCKHIHMC